jgi:hypothetical protein
VLRSRRWINSFHSFDWKKVGFFPGGLLFIYINDELGEDVAAFFGKIEPVGQITDPDARERGTQVFLSSHPRSNFNNLIAKAWERVEGE